jgi:L-lactate dehydrogenase complex protein LldG
MIDDFIKEITDQTGEVYRVKNNGEAAEALVNITKEKQISKVIASTDSVIHRVDLAGSAAKSGIEIRTADDFKDRNALKAYAFKHADAGLTGVDYGVAESGTLCLVHDENQPRLVSLAPLYHIALLPVKHLVPIYEQAVEQIFSTNGLLPSQVSFITGPSMTADIQATSFKGMHGPKHLIVILL